MKKATLLKKRPWYTCEFVKIFKNTYFYRTPLVFASEFSLIGDPGDLQYFNTTIEKDKVIIAFELPSLEMFLFCYLFNEFQPRCSYKVCSYIKKCNCQPQPIVDIYSQYLFFLL